MLLSRIRPAAGVAKTIGMPTPPPDQSQKFPKLEEFLDKRDYVGALTLLEFQRSVGSLVSPTLIAYSAFHLGDYKKAAEEYQAAIESNMNTLDDPNYLNLACCYFSLGMYSEAQDAAEKGPDGDLRLRILFHLAAKLGDEHNLIEIHDKLDDIPENELSLASMHFIRGDFQSALDVYKRLLLENSFGTIPSDSDSSPHSPNVLSTHMVDLIRTGCEGQLPMVEKLLHNREFLALNVYVALCYNRMEYFDISQEVLAVYLQTFPDSAIALNLRACNVFFLSGGAAAERELKELLKKMKDDEQTKHGCFSNAYDLIRHNLVVYRDGESALQVFPKLVDVIPEARWNMIVYYLKHDDITTAYALLKEMKTESAQELVLQACVNVLLSQQTGNREFLAVAQSCYSRIGAKESENDTVFGRLCMASAHFLNLNFDHATLYMNSVRAQYYNDDTFNFNFAQALAMQNQYHDAEKVLNLIQSEKIRNDLTYIHWMTRCLIMNKKPIVAWETYERMETSPESFVILEVIANECYRMGQFYYAAKAFDILEKYDPSQDNWDGKLGACIGVFQLIIAGHEPRESLPDIIALLRRSPQENVERIVLIMRKWASDNRINL